MKPLTRDNERPNSADSILNPKRDAAIILGLIFVGGTCGTGARAFIEIAFPADGWPWATFLINIGGTAALALLVQVLAALGTDSGWRHRVRLGLGTGVLGGFTTYSTFAVETVMLAQDIEFWLSLAYSAGSVFAGLTVALLVFYLTDKFLTIRGSG